MTTLLAHILGALLASHPFAVGETLRYDAKLGYFPVGTATVSVSRRAPERGVDAYVFTMAGQGGPPGWRVRYDLTSWVDSRRFNSLRFHRQLVQAGKAGEHEYVILPDSSRYREVGMPSRDRITIPALSRWTSWPSCISCGPRRFQLGRSVHLLSLFQDRL